MNRIKEIAIAALRKTRRMTQAQRLARADQVVRDTLQCFVGERVAPDTIERIRLELGFSLGCLVTDRVVRDGRIELCRMEDGGLVKVQIMLMFGTPGYTILDATLQM